MGKFFSLLRYSFGNEDWRTEEEALDIQPNDTILCITASGDRPLNLLKRECQKIVSVDANPLQNHLLQLKASALQVLEYKEYLSFIGANQGRNRHLILKNLLPFMNEEAAKYWNAHQKKIVKGILYQGTLERLTYFISRFFAVFRGKKIKRLFSFNNIEDQRKFLRDEWDRPLLRKLFNLVLNTFLSRVIIEDPGLINYGKDIKPGDYIYDRIYATLERELAKKNPLLSLILRGRVSSEAYPPYLTEEGTRAIKQRLACLEIKTANVISYLESIKKPTFDIFSLSDVPSYLSYSDFVRLLEGIVKTAKPGARFCLRQFLSTYEIPEHLQSYFVRDKSLERRLERLDNCFVYRFITGTIALPMPKVSPKKKKKLDPDCQTAVLAG